MKSDANANSKPVDHARAHGRCTCGHGCNSELLCRKTRLSNPWGVKPNRGKLVRSLVMLLMRQDGAQLQESSEFCMRTLVLRPRVFPSVSFLINVCLTLRNTFSSAQNRSFNYFFRNCWSIYFGTSWKSWGFNKQKYCILLNKSLLLLLSLNIFKVKSQTR